MRKRLKSLSELVERKTGAAMVSQEHTSKHIRLVFQSGPKTAVVVVSSTPSDCVAASHRVVSDVRRQLV